MIDDKRLGEMAEEWVYAHLPAEGEPTLAYVAGFRACEAKADKLAEVLSSLIHYSDMASHRLLDSDNIPLSCSVEVARKALSAYQGEKS